MLNKRRFNKKSKLACAIAVILPLMASTGCNAPKQAATSEVVDVTKQQLNGELNFEITEGNVFNQFYRQDNVAAHSLFTSGNQPRAVVAFPAGNSGVSLWFAETHKAVNWQQIGETLPAHDSTLDGDALHGVAMQYQVDADKLEVEQAILGSVRVIRSYVYSHQVPSEMVNELSVNDNTITWYRDRLDGQGGYKLQVSVENGTISEAKNGNVQFIANANKPMQLSLLALSGDKPLTPIRKDQLLKQIPQNQTLTADVLAYLSYEEKMMAGSWRFQTYFGRDTLLSLAMLMPNLTDTATQAGLSSVIERLAPSGEVAHEEDVGEFAILRHLREQQKNDVSPLFDYKMMDDNYMLSIISAQYLLGDSVNAQQAQAFLQRKNARGQSYADLLVENFKLVLETAKPYVQNPTITNLISLKEGEHFGEWRDSHEGLGYGRIPYNVNAVFVPAALQSIASFKQSGLMDDAFTKAGLHLDVNDIQTSANTWLTSSEHFKVSLTAQQAKLRQQRYLQARQMDSTIEGLDLDAKDTQFYAVSLNKDGSPVEIMNSDIGFSLLFANPTHEQLSIAVNAILAPFPQGLLSDVGMMVASGVYADVKLYPYVTNNHYHGEVVWSWQQALFAAGLNKQLARRDLPSELRAQLVAAKQRLWAVINKTQAVKQAELWTWDVENNRMRIRPFGQQAGNKTESNAAQLWSTVYLSIKQ